MKTKYLTCRFRTGLLAAFTLIASLSALQAATNDVGSLLQKGLFEEEANHNLDAAIQAYQSAILQTDKDHQFAATAIFRLGECYRKQGKTNEASAQYQRILREFPDQTELVKLSRSYVGDAALAGNGPQPVLTVVTDDPEAEELKRIKAMIKDNPDLINGRGGQNTPLMRAVEDNQLAVARFLLDNKADVNGRSGGGGASAINEAAAQDHKEMVKLLLDYGADVNDTSSTSERFAPLHLAASRGYTSLAELLLARKADVNIKTTSGKTPLHLAAAQGFKASADLLLAHGADVNARDNSGETPLHLAAASGNKATVELLLAHKADVNAKKTTGETPLHFAVKSDRNEIVKLLLDSRADPNVKATVYLEGLPPNQNTRPYADFAPLTIAGFKGQKQSAELLLTHKADVNTKDSNGDTPLCWSVTKNQPQIAELLLANGADVNTQNDSHWSPLSLAVNNNAPEMVRLILAHQPKVDVLDSDKLTPLQRAIIQGQSQEQLQIVELLLKAGADANTFYQDHQTPLHVAVARMNKPMVELLLAHKANPDLQDNSGNTPLSLAKVERYGQLSQQQRATVDQIAELLRKAGANENLQRLSSIGVSRGNFEQNIFLKGTNAYNHFSLFELVAMVGFPSDWPNGANRGSGGGFYGNREPSSLRFPDFAKVNINRLDPNGRTNIVNINLETAFESVDCSKDMPLQWGDIVEIPESDHKVSENWLGLSPLIRDALTKCLERKVEIIVKGQATRITLVPMMLPHGMPPPPANIQGNIQFAASASAGMLATFRLREVVNSANVLLASSDTTRVKVKRANSATGQTDEMIFNLDKTDPNNDLWLRDGDVIEIPEKP